MVLESPQSETVYDLKSELFRASLGATEREEHRPLAWVNAICALFFIIGAVGSKPLRIEIKPLPPQEEATAAIVEPLPPQTPTEPQKVEQENEEPTDSPQVVVVTPMVPNISFSVPTIGNLVVAATIAKAPPLAPLKTVAPLRSQPVRINTTGEGGERPQPPYPRAAIERGQQGSVTLRLTVNDAGLIDSIQIIRSSGFSLLDHGAMEFVKRRWSVPLGAGGRIYEASINYKLQSN
jgi:TonB family protein